MISYLKFLLKSTNEHGVHSPFVFGYLTKCLYTKPKLSNSKAENVLLKSISYFGYKNLAVFNNAKIEILISTHFPNITYHKAMTDLAYFENPDLDGILQLLQQQALQNHGMIFIHSLRGSPTSKKLWHKIIEHPQIQVSIDFFHCGVVFIRKEQAKEHFTIRP